MRSNTHSERRRGVAMLMVLISLAIATVLSTAYLASRDNSAGIGENVASASRARWAAQTGLDLGLAILQTEADWRTAHTDGKLMDDFPLVGGATLDLDVVDVETGEPPTATSTVIHMIATGAADGVEQQATALLEVEGGGGAGKVAAVDLSEFAVFSSSTIVMMDDSTITRWPNSPLAGMGNRIAIGTRGGSAGDIRVQQNAAAIDTTVYHGPSASGSLILNDGPEIQTEGLLDEIPMPAAPDIPVPLPGWEAPAGTGVGTVAGFIDPPALYELGSTVTLEVEMYDGAPSDPIVHFKVYDADTDLLLISNPEEDEPYQMYGEMLDTLSPGDYRIEVTVRDEDARVTVDYFELELTAYNAGATPVVESHEPDLGVGTATTLSVDARYRSIGLGTASGILTLQGDITLIADRQLRLFDESGIVIDGDVTIVAFGGIRMDQDSYIELAPGATLTVYTDDVFELNDAYIGDPLDDRTVRDNSGNATWMDPKRITLFGSSNTSVLSLRNQSVVKGSVYMPQTPAVIADNSALYGRIAAGDIVLMGNGAIFYDHTLDTGNGYNNPNSALFTADGHIEDVFTTLLTLTADELEKLNADSDITVKANSREFGDGGVPRVVVPVDGVATPRPVPVELTILSMGHDVEKAEQDLTPGGVARDMSEE